MQVALGTIFRYATHDFVRHVGRGGDLAAIEINRKRFIALVGEFGGLVFHPVVQSPPFVDDDQRRKRALAGRSVEHALHGFVAAFVGDGFAVGGEGGECEKQQQEYCSSVLHDFNLDLSCMFDCSTSDYATHNHNSSSI